MENRVIKFRIWNGAEMVYDVTIGKFGAFYVNPGSKGDGLDEKDSASLTPFNTKYHNDTPVMQFTGLKDKNGNEIYEGDILEDDDCFGAITGGDLNPTKRLVVWNAEEAKFEMAFLDVKYYAEGFRPSGRYLCVNNSDTYEVIGHIYEKLELLTP